jgi:hypothetical protein
MTWSTGATKSSRVALGVAMAIAVVGGIVVMSNRGDDATIGIVSARANPPSTATTTTEVTTAPSPSTTTFEPNIPRGTFAPPPDDSPSPCDLDPTLTCELADGAVFDERWMAIVTLECGSEPTTRRISAFDTETAGYGEAVLSTARRQSGGYLTTGNPTVGDEIEVDGLIFFWNIHKVLLGPWDLDNVFDVCDDPNANPITSATEAPRPEPTEG